MVSLEVVVLAAGLGTRMKSDTPKVLHQVCDEPMICWLIDRLDRVLKESGQKIGIKSARFNIVVGHGRELVQKTVLDFVEKRKIKTPFVFTTQEQQLGTGHAVKLALAQKSSAEIVAVFNGDLPLFTEQAFSEFLLSHIKNKSAATLASATLPDAGQYGRVVRKGKKFTGVVEYKDATAAQKKIKEFNGGVYLFDRKLLDTLFSKNLIKNKNASGEFYLPDVFSAALKLKKTIYAHHFDDNTVIAGVNNMKELAEAQSVLYLRKAEELMQEGAFLAEPRHTYVSPRVKVGKSVRIGPFTVIHGDSEIGDFVKIGSHCELKNVQIGIASQIKNCTVAENSVIGKECAVGPMAHFRSGTKIKDKVKIGNFVEIKESEIGSKTAVSHLSYVGDATVGENSNIGCGFVTCNYDGVVRDGKRKHRSVIGNNVFIGSDSQVVAPITIADGTFIASGSSVTESVLEPDSLVIARTKQVTKPGYAKKYKS